jgi:outer membrane protein OmpA-like peptidoglycan-associated protein
MPACYRTEMKSISLIWAILLTISMHVFSAHGGEPRASALHALDQIPNSMAAQFNAWVNDGKRDTFTLGEAIEFNFRANTDVYISIAHVDTHGILSLFQPDLGAAANRLSSNITMTFPPPSSGLSINIEPPLGEERIYYVATKKPLRQDVFSNTTNTGASQAALYQAGDSTRLAQRFVAAIVASNDARGVSVVIADYKVTPRAGGVQYTKQDIIGFFTTRSSRSIANPRLDADIRFESNSATLTREAKDNLDVWGESLMHPYLAQERFQIGGHTDDLGSEAHNLTLSHRRAKSVSDYLTSKFGVDDQRLTIQAFGESAPKTSGSDELARAANRRVEFQQINE